MFSSHFLFNLQVANLKDFLQTRMLSRKGHYLQKFKQCYDLYTASRPLCRHEVALLAIRCSSLGCWFPVRFPNVSVIPKFHVFTYHISEKAYSRRTVGMEAEHVSECIHCVTNSLNRTYHTVQNVNKRLELVFKTQSLRSNCTLKIFMKPVKCLNVKKHLAEGHIHFVMHLLSKLMMGSV